MTKPHRRLLRACACIAALGVSGCGSVRYPAYYTLHFAPSAPVAEAARSIGSLTIKELRCPEYLCEGRIVYRPTPSEVSFYQYHRWATSPRAMVADYLAERVRAQSLFTSVFTDESRITTDYVLTGTLEQLEEVDDARHVTALCTISAQLVDTRTRAVVWSRTATEQVSVEKRDVAGVVNGLAAAVRAAVDRLVTGMDLGRGAVPRDVP